MNDINLDVIVAEIIIVLRKYSTKNIEITPETRIFHDLMIYGDDAWNFLDEVSVKYHIEGSSFEGGLYFPSEGEMIWFLKCFSFFKNNWKPLTINGLANVVLERVRLKEINCKSSDF